MAQTKDLKVVFHVEPADRGVGIMAESFAAWEENGTCWCDLREISISPRRIVGRKIIRGKQEYLFDWYDNDSCEKTEPPRNAKMIEVLLVAYIESWYDQR